MLARALQMSVQGESTEPAAAQVASAGETTQSATDDFAMMTEEEQIAYALRLSMQPGAGKRISRCAHAYMAKVDIVIVL